MYLVRLIRWLRGYVVFSAEGVFCERFLNLLINNKFNLWDACKQNGAVYGCITACDYPKLRLYAKKTGTKIRIKEKHGFPFGIKRYKKRKGIPFGIAAFVFSIVLMSMFTWKIQINGNERIPDDVIINRLSELGVHTGSFRFQIDARDVEEKMRLSFDDISWIAVNIRGSKIDVEIKERILPPEKIAVGRPCNIIAGKTGQIMYLEIYDGQPLLKIGDSVKKGEIIISGVVEDKTEHTYYRQARAKVIAKTNESFSITIPMETEILQKNGIKNCEKGIVLLGKEFNFTPKKDYNYSVFKVTNYDKIKILLKPSPIILKTQNQYYQSKKSVKITQEHAKRLALNRLSQIEWAIINNGGEVISKKINGSVYGNKFILTVQLACRENIAAEQPIFIEE